MAETGASSPANMRVGLVVFCFHHHRGMPHPRRRSIGTLLPSVHIFFAILSFIHKTKFRYCRYCPTKYLQDHNQDCTVQFVVQYGGAKNSLAGSKIALPRLK